MQAKVALGAGGGGNPIMLQKLLKGLVAQAWLKKFEISSMNEA